MKRPIARKATSLTMDSKAMAATSPSCRSLASRCLVPNRMVKAASRSATTKAVSPQKGRSPCDRHPYLRVVRQDGEAPGDRLELQRDVGDHADDGDDGHQTAEELALAVTRGDEVGDGGDALGLADPHHLEQERAPQERHQGGAEVDGQESQTVLRGATDAAVEGPCRAVDGERECVDGWTGDDRTALLGAPIGPVGDRKEEPEVGEGDTDDQRAVDHASIPARVNPVSATRSRPRRRLRRPRTKRDRQTGAGPRASAPRSRIASPAARRAAASRPGRAAAGVVAARLHEASAGTGGCGMLKQYRPSTHGSYQIPEDG